MTCPRHSHCAFTGTESGICPGCHAPIAKITAPAEHRVTRIGKSRETGEPVTRVESTFPGGYGETFEAHMARHAVTDAQEEASRHRRQAQRASRATNGPVRSEDTGPLPENAQIGSTWIPA